MIHEIPLVSVCLITYNHASYIRQAIESILKQRVNFSWELIIADDCSTDGTREIVREYQQRYPNFIRLILQEKNVGASQNWLDLTSAPNGKYMAQLEGDDYWTDEHKLQKQVDILIQNPDCSFCFTNLQKYVQKTGEYFPVFIQNISNHRITFKDYIEKGGYISSLTVVSRFDLYPKKFPDFYPKVIKQDWFIFLNLLKKGNGFYLDEVTGVYRYHEKSALMNIRAVALWKNNIYLVENTKNFFYPEYQQVLSNAISWHLEELAFSYLDEYAFFEFLRNMIKSVRTGDRKSFPWFWKNFERLARWGWYQCKSLIKQLKD